MKLLLTSNGISNKSIELALLELLGKPFYKSSVVFIPTAANVEEGDKTWLADDIKNLKKLGFSAVDIIDIATVPKNVWLPVFEKADVLLFGGGNTDYLLGWIEKTGLKELIPSLLQTKVYVGISAGSIVASKNAGLSYEGVLYYEKTGSFIDREGIGLVDFEIRPHLNSEQFPGVRLDNLEKLARKHPVTFYAIDDETAIQIIDGAVSVVSEGKWTKFH